MSIEKVVNFAFGEVSLQFSNVSLVVLFSAFIDGIKNTAALLFLLDGQ